MNPVNLNFKVPALFKRDFKIAAAHKGLLGGGATARDFRVLGQSQHHG